MSRLTRCPACTTVFRVTDEQLDSRQGFVRCGQCAKVFDARASLAEAREPAPGEPPAESASGEAGEHTAAFAGDAAPPADDAAHAPFDPAIDAAGNVADAALDADADSTDGPPAGPADASDAPPEDADPFEGMDVEEIVLSLDEPDPAESSQDATHPAASIAAATPAVEDAAAAEIAAPAPAPIPAAIARPRAAADDDEPLPFGPRHRARSRAAAAAWGVGALMLLVVLAAQAAYWFRAELAAALPAAKPYLELACRQLKCTVPPPRQTALLSIESSELQVDKSVPGLLTLIATLRNRAAFAQAHPSIELTLTDADDRPMSRRVLAPADYLGDRLAKDPLFPAVSEHTVRLHIDATAYKPTGYRLFLFHP